MNNACFDPFAHDPYLPKKTVLILSAKRMAPENGVSHAFSAPGSGGREQIMSGSSPPIPVYGNTGKVIPTNLPDPSLPYRL